MALAIACPHCGERPVEVVRNAWFVGGFLLYHARRGSRRWVGCSSCTRALVLRNLRDTATFGWFALPWGFGVPAVIVQNLVAAFSTPDPEELGRCLACQGLDIDDVTLDAQGRSAADDALVQAVTAVLHAMTWADGAADDREVAVGVAVARRVLGSLVSEAEIARALRQPTCGARLAVDPIGPDGLLLLLKAACAVAAADGVLEDSEVEALRSLGGRLGLDAEQVEQFVIELRAAASEGDALRASAARILGCEPNVCEAEARAALRRGLVACGELGSPADAAAQREQLQGAYKKLVVAA